MKNHYRLPDANLWQGRLDSLPNERFFQIVQCVDLHKPLPIKEHAKHFAILGFCCDAGVRRNLGRAGASEGPKAIRQVLAKLPVNFQHDTILFDVGDIVCIDDDLESAQQALAEAVAMLLKQNIKPIVLGGGHEMAWGHYQGIVAANPQADVGIINFDAHFDLRPLKDDKGHSGSPFLQIAQARQAQNLAFNYFCLGIQKTGNTASLFSTAESLHTEFVLAEDIHAHTGTNYFFEVDEFIMFHEHIYLTLCMDVFAQAYAPGVSAPQVLGLLPWQVIQFLRYIVKSGKVINFDIAELAPALDRDHMTAQLAATMVAEYIQTPA